MRRLDHLLLVTPRFHGYWRPMRAGLERAGHRVSTLTYDEPDGFVERAANWIMHRREPFLPVESMKRRLTEAVLERMQNDAFDGVVFVRSDVFGDSLWNHLDDAGTPHVLWLYDEIRRMDITDDFLASRPAVATYSPGDAAHLASFHDRVLHLPTGFDVDTRFTPAPTDSITFIGARYPGREAALTDLQQRGVPVEVFGDSWDRSLRNIVRTQHWRGSGLRAHPNIDRAAAYGVMAGSPATLNIHGDQDGFTVRTYEACGVGGLQVTERTDIGEIYDIDAEVLVYRSPEELEEHCRRALADPRWADGIRRAARARTLAEHTFDRRMSALSTFLTETA